MKVLNFIWEYRFLIMLAVWFLLTYVFVGWEKFKSNIKTGMIAAKQLSKKAILKNGYEQREWVVNYVLQKLPKGYVKALGEYRIRMLIEKLYKAAIDLIDDGKLNGSI